ncbi:tryptamine:oxygen oxidoreductase (deaminating) [Mactra antiquata]
MAREKKKKDKPTVSIEENGTTSTTPEDEGASRIPLTKHRGEPIVVDDFPDKSRFILQVVAIFSSFLSVILLAIVVILAFHMGAVQYCFQNYRSSTRNSDSPQVFDDMTVSEYHAVTDYMLHRSGIGLTHFDSASVNSSYIYMIDLHIPLKSAVLEYLDRGSVRLKRVAKVIVVRGDLETPKVEEYLVFPLPNPNSHRLARNPLYVRFPIPYTSRPVDHIDYKELYSIIRTFSKDIYHILMESYGLCYHNCTINKNCIVFRDVAPRGQKSGDRNTWFWAFRDVEGYYLHPLGLQIQINHKSNFVNEWKIDRIVYNGKLSYTVDSFLERYEKGIKLNKIKQDIPVGKNQFLYSSMYRREYSDIPEAMPGPRFVDPAGPRYTVEGQHVKYMHWDFDIHMRTSTGVQIFDVRFQSERIAYELSLQESVVFHAGYGPTMTMSNLYLASWMIGASSYELVRGVDCPDTAAFLDTHFFVDTSKPLFYRNVVCIFEVNSGVPLRRHYTPDTKGGFTHYGGLVDHHLVVRHIATIWSKDYIIDYIFRVNGEIETRVSTTGYLQSTYKLPFEKIYGNPIYYDVTANVYQQLFHFKLDLDIGRLENRYSVIDIETEHIRHPWYSSANLTQFVLKEKRMEREMDIVVADETDAPRYHLIYAEHPVNKYEVKRAYRIINNNYVKNVLKDKKVTNAAKWANYPIVVTQYDDTEDHSSSIYAQNDPWEPVVNFERFVTDNDTIVNRDLVAWATVGFFHIPRTEDVPSITTPTQTVSLTIAPFNFFTECPSVSSPSGVVIKPIPGSNKISVNTFGTDRSMSCVPPTYGPESFFGFRTVE